jgi:hypothetical protein
MAFRSCPACGASIGESREACACGHAFSGEEPTNENPAGIGWSEDAARGDREARAARNAALAGGTVVFVLVAFVVAAFVWLLIAVSEHGLIAH